MNQTMARSRALTVSEWLPETSSPVLDTTVGGILCQAAEIASDGIAVIDGRPDADRSWTFAQLREDSERVARALLTHFHTGDRVAVWAPNSPEWLVLQFAAALAGMTLVTLNPALRKPEAAYVLRQSRAAGVFTVQEFRGAPLAAWADQLRDELPGLAECVRLDSWDRFVAGAGQVRLPSVDPGDAAMIQYTSGTTGTPKGAVLHHRGVTNLSRFIAQRMGLGPDDTWLTQMPLFHVAGCAIAALGAVQMRSPQVLLPFETGRVLHLIERYRCTAMVAAPTMFAMMRDHVDYEPRSLSSLRVVAAGGSPVPPDLARALEREIGCTFCVFFGQTETSGCFTQTFPDDAEDDRVETIGVALPNVAVRVAGPDGASVPVGDVGEICTRGFHVMSGYNDMPDQTDAAIDAAGWLHTGDLGTMDARGYLRVAGRLKDMIIRGGENIYPREVEECLLAHPAVAEAAVVGVPDSKWGETVAAFIRFSQGARATEDELFAHCRARLAPFKTPRTWRFVDQLPLTPSGKVQKFRLREQLAEERGATAR